jgi:WD40 repeat protein
VTPSRAFEAEGPLSALALSPTGSEIAAAGKSGTTQVFSIAGKLLRSFSSGAPPAVSLSYSGDGRRIVAGAGRYVLVMDAASGARLASWQAHEKDIEAVACSRDGSLIASASDDDTVKLWKAHGAALATLPGGVEPMGVAVSPSGDWVAAGASDTKVRLYPAKAGAPNHVLEFPMACPFLVFSPDSRMLAACSVDGSVLLIDVVSGQARGAIGRHALPAGAAAFSADGGRLVSASLSINPWGAEADAKLYDLTTRKETAAPIGVCFLNAAGFSSAGRPLVVGSRERTISVFEL